MPLVSSLAYALLTLLKGDSSGAERDNEDEQHIDPRCVHF